MSLNTLSAQCLVGSKTKSIIKYKNFLEKQLIKKNISFNSSQDTIFVSGYVEEIIYNLSTKDSSIIIKSIFGINNVQKETIGLFKNSYLEVGYQKSTLISCKACLEKFKEELLSEKKYNWKKVDNTIYFSDKFIDDYKLTLIN